MAPIRRYLRITKYSVLECRIYVEGNPALAETWLFRKGDPALPRIIEAIRPNVLPKLREENARAKAKGRGKANRAVKDVVIQDDFEASIYLKDNSSRHSLLIKQKTFNDKSRIKSNSTKLTSWLTAGTTEKPIDVDAEDVAIQNEEEDGVDISAIPEAPLASGNITIGDDEEETLFVNSSDSEKDFFQTQVTPRRRKDKENVDMDDEGNAVGGDDKKKLGLQTRYEGFSIYGRILCIMVKRRGGPTAIGGAAGQTMMEDWVSTQVQQELENGAE